MEKGTKNYGLALLATLALYAMASAVEAIGFRFHLPASICWALQSGPLLTGVYVRLKKYPILGICMVYIFGAILLRILLDFKTGLPEASGLGETGADVAIRLILCGIIAWSIFHKGTQAPPASPKA